MHHMTPSNYSAKVIHGEYYPHIDGIRAFAVLPVVLFHVLACLCPGGFAGVDVFFVISGYLITGGILRDLEKGRFTIRNFYHRRIKRIMPAYFALIAGVFAAGCVIYYALPLIYLGDTAVMGTLFSANIYFYIFSGNYFAPDVHNNALLHLWSLSVEEQFYLFIPILCAIIWKFRRNWLLPTFAGITILSFAGAVYAIASGKQDGAFYLLHFRAWELLAGSLLAIAAKRGLVDSATQSSATVPGRTPERGRSGHYPAAPFPSASATSPLPSPQTSHPLLASLGLLMVLVPYAALSATTPFPGLAALSSVIGTALLIRYGNTGWISRLLAWRPFVATGKISYSLYLWHWPVTVFWKYAVYDQLYWYDYAGMFLLSFLLAALSWRFVEVPVRASPAWTMRRSFAFAAAGIVLLTSIGLACVFSNGWPTILHKEANAVSPINEFQSRVVRICLGAQKHLFAACGRKSDDPFPLAFGAPGNFHLGVAGKSPEFLLIGDSHAGHLQYGLNALLNQDMRAGYSINRSSTNMFDLKGADSKYVMAWLDARPEIAKVVLASNWVRRIEMDTPEAVYGQIASLARRMRSSGRTLYVLAGTPHFDSWSSGMPSRMKLIEPRKMEPGWNGRQSETSFDSQMGATNRNLEVICERTGAVFVPLHAAMKHDNYYTAIEEDGASPALLYRDEHHLSRAGSLRAAQFIMPYLFPSKMQVAK